MQTSTVTVAVLDRMPSAEVQVREQDLIWETCRGTGSGGQKRNKTESTVVLTHRPSGVRVRCEVSRDQRQNRVQALRILRERLRDLERARTRQERADSRREQVGSGMRGDKRRTIRSQDDSVVDHVTGRRWRLKDYLRGEW